MKKKIPAVFCALLALILTAANVMRNYPKKVFRDYRAQKTVVQLPQIETYPKAIPEEPEEEPKINFLDLINPEDSYNARYYTEESLGTFYVTAYCDCARCCTYANQPTASGVYCHSGYITTCASDTSVLPFGTIILVDGRLYVCEDTGSAVIGNHVDLYFDSHDEVESYGSNYQEIYIVEFPYGTPEYD